MSELAVGPRTLRVTGVRNRTVAAALALVAAVGLPEVFHSLGAAVGVGPGIAQSLLPMHLPVLLVGLLAGPVVGVVTGAAAPLIAFALSGMPPAALLPVMVAELAAYGLASGLLAGRRFGVAWKVLIAQVAGRAVRLAVSVIAVGAAGFAGIWDATLAACPGLVVQWCLIPLVMYWVGRGQRVRER